MNTWNPCLNMGNVLVRLLIVYRMMIVLFLRFVVLLMDLLNYRDRGRSLWENVVRSGVRLGRVLMMRPVWCLMCMMRLVLLEILVMRRILKLVRDIGIFRLIGGIVIMGVGLRCGLLCLVAIGMLLRLIRLIWILNVGLLLLLIRCILILWRVILFMMEMLDRDRIRLMLDVSL